MPILARLRKTHKSKTHFLVVWLNHYKNRTYFVDIERTIDVKSKLPTKFTRFMFCFIHPIFRNLLDCISLSNPPKN